MSIEAIKKALEGVKPDRLRYEADAMYAAVQGEKYGDTFHAFNWADKPHRVLYYAINLIRDSASEIDRLQRENAELKAERDEALDDAKFAEHIAAKREFDAAASAEAAEAEVKRLQTELALSKPLYSRRQIEARVKLLEAALKPFRTVSKDWVDETGWTDVACQNDRIVDWFGPSDFLALASTGGEHHGN